MVEDGYSILKKGEPTMTNITPERLAEIASEIVSALYGKPTKRTRGKIDYLKLFQLIEVDDNGKYLSDKLFKHKKTLVEREKDWSEQGKHWKMRIARFDCRILAEDENWLIDNPIEDMTEKQFRKYLEDHNGF